jgi:transposase InsO family protein
LRTDNGTEYTNKEFKKYLRKFGIRHQTTVPYNPEQNGLAERMNRTLVERAKSMIFDADLHKKYWAEAGFCMDISTKPDISEYLDTRIQIP